MSKRIFVVEDETLTVNLLKLYLEFMGYEFAGNADNGEEALERIAKSQPDLVLMDIVLNGKMDGIEVASRLRDEGKVAVIYLTAYSDAETLARAKPTEPIGYITKPFTDQGLKAGIEMGLYKLEMERKQQRILDGVVQTIAELVRLHNPLLHEAQIRAAALAEAIATEMHLPAKEVKGIRIAALLHGIGMTAMSVDLMSSRHKQLKSPVKEHFERHPVIAWKLLKDIEFPTPVADMVYQHMERLDGSGYPRGLDGDSIMKGSRIVAVSCALAAMLRPHGNEPAESEDDALLEIERGSGTLFDAEVVDACVRLFREKGFSKKELVS